MSDRPGLVMGWREPWRTVRLKSLPPWLTMCLGYLGCGSMPNTVVKTLFSIVEDFPQNKMEKGSNAKLRHCYNQNDLLNTNWSCCTLLQFFSGFQWPVWDVKSRSLCRYFNPSHQPLLLSSAWWSMNPHPLYIPGRWTIWLRFSPHTPPWCAHTVTSAWNDCPWLVPRMGFYSSFNSQLQSLLLCLSSSFPKGPQHFALASMEAMVIFFITVCMSYLQGDCKFLKGEMESPYLSP